MKTMIKIITTIYVVLIGFGFSVAQGLDDNQNFISDKAFDYDLNGNQINQNLPIVESRTYFNAFHDTQVQTKQFRYNPGTYGHILITPYEYDNQNNLSRTYLTSPVSNSDFGFESNFVEYDVNGNLIQSNQNKAGWYYSDNNLLDYFQDATHSPFIETKHLYNSGLENFMQISPGNVFHDNEISAYAYAIPANGEIEDGIGYSDILTNNNNFNHVSDVTNLDYYNDVVKSLSFLPDGAIKVQYSDKEGNIIASSDHEGDNKTTTANLGRDMYYANTNIDISPYPNVIRRAIHNFGNNDPIWTFSLDSWELEIQVSISGDPTNKIELFELQTVGGERIECGSCTNMGLQDENSFSYIVSDDYFATNSITDIQLRSFVPFSATFIYRLAYTKDDGSASGNQNAPEEEEDPVPPGLGEYVVEYPKNVNSKHHGVNDHLELLLWNSSDCNVTFSEGFPLVAKDLFKEGNNVIYSDYSTSFNICPAGGLRTNEDPCLIDKPTIVRFEIDNSNLIFSELYSIPFSYIYKDDYAQVTYSYKQANSDLKIYDDINNLRFEIPKKSFENGINEWIEYQYDSRNNLKKIIDPDRGSMEFVHNELGQIRFSQNEEQEKNGYYTYINYDQKGRMIEKGEFRPSGSQVPDNSRFFESHDDVINGGYSIASNSIHSILNNIGEDDGLADINCFEVAKFVYDKIDDNCPKTESQRFVYGNLSNWSFWDSKLATEPSSQKWISYNEQGHTEWEISTFSEWLGNYSSNAFKYTILGRLEEAEYKDKNGKLFTHKYEYDEDQNLLSVKTKYSENFNEVLNVEYSYNYVNQSVRTELAENQQGLDFIRSVSSGLKSINHPTLARTNQDDFDDLLRMHYEYYDGDYIKDFSVSGIKSITEFEGTNNPIETENFYDGRLKSVGWKTANPNFIPGVSGNYMYFYEYDEDNQMTSASFGYSNEHDDYMSFQELEIFSEDVNYDVGGNINSLERTSETSTLINDFDYQYYSNNQLGFIANNSGVEIEYVYNDLGNVTEIHYRDHPEANYKEVYFEYYSYDRVKSISLYKYGLEERAEEDKKIVYVYNAQRKLVKKYYKTAVSESNNGSGEDPTERLVGEPPQGDLTWTWKNTKLIIYDRNNTGQVNSEYSTYFPIEEGEIVNTNKYPFYGKKRLGYFDPNISNELNIYDNEVVEGGSGEDPDPSPTPFVGEYLYELRDHQENVRVVFIPTINGPEIVNANEFYAFGQTFREFQSMPYEHNYQGLFTYYEPLTNLVEFEARPYDPLIGRWLMTDPASQFQSPYNGMGNLPAIVIDPNGEEIITAMIIAVAVSATTYTAGVAFSPGGFQNWSWKEFTKQALISTAMAAASAGIHLFYTKFQTYNLVEKVGVEVARGLTHGASSSFINYAADGIFDNSSSSQATTFASAAISSYIGSITGVATSKTGITTQKIATVAASATSGGISSHLNGGKFWEGFRNGAIISMYNHLLQELAYPKPDPVDIFEDDDVVAGLAEHFKYIGHRRNKKLYHLRDVVKSFKAPPSEENVFIQWVDGFFGGGGFMGEDLRGEGTWLGMEVDWLITPAAWSGYGDESVWQNHKWNDIHGITPYIYEDGGKTIYQIKLWSQRPQEGRVRLKFHNLADFKKAYNYFTGE